MKFIYKWFILSMLITSIYKYRYKIANSLLGNAYIRRYAVNLSMKIPYLRSIFIQSTFK
ncbi:hypothetical protein WAK64_02060 [Bacillus spongiae]|uniref:Uncharacterized protein n=1 Tax=Bacillus spongiae TaxID=2683610 RepID=A0ABU8H9H0_9BACI